MSHIGDPKVVGRAGKEEEVRKGRRKRKRRNTKIS